MTLCHIGVLLSVFKQRSTVTRQLQTTKLGHETFVRRWSSPNLTSGVVKMLWPRPLALRSSMAPLISILTLPFRFMWGLLTRFTQAVYWHLLPSLSLLVASTHSFSLCCCCFGLYFIHPSVYLVLVPLLFLFEQFFQGFLDKEPNTVRLSAVLNTENTPTSSNSYFCFLPVLSASCSPCCASTLLMGIVEPPGKANKDIS